MKSRNTRRCADNAYVEFLSLSPFSLLPLPPRPPPPKKRKKLVISLILDKPLITFNKKKKIVIFADVISKHFSILHHPALKSQKVTQENNFDEYITYPERNINIISLVFRSFKRKSNSVDGITRYSFK